MTAAMSDDSHMDVSDLQRALREIADSLDTGRRIIPGSSWRDSPPTPAQKRLVAKKLRDLADRIEGESDG